MAVHPETLYHGAAPHHVKMAAHESLHVAQPLVTGTALQLLALLSSQPVSPLQQARPPAELQVLQRMGFRCHQHVELVLPPPCFECQVCLPLHKD